jgi:diguanylate cyclase (GGDEF)-like protein
MAENIRTSIAATPIILSNQTVYVTISIGVGCIAARHISCDKSFAHFYSELDKALYRAKENGRSRVESYTFGKGR